MCRSDGATLSGPVPDSRYERAVAAEKAIGAAPHLWCMPHAPVPSRLHAGLSMLGLFMLPASCALKSSGLPAATCFASRSAGGHTCASGLQAAHRSIPAAAERPRHIPTGLLQQTLCWHIC